jgi:hypothetical protein
LYILTTNNRELKGFSEAVHRLVDVRIARHLTRSGVVLFRRTGNARSVCVRRIKALLQSLGSDRHIKLTSAASLSRALTSCVRAFEKPVPATPTDSDIKDERACLG